jgi:hypothetical protein
MMVSSSGAAGPLHWKEEIDAIGQNQRLASRVTIAYCQCLERMYPERGKIITAALFNGESIDGRRPTELAKAYLSNPPALLFIPFVYPEHIVTIACDFKARVVEFYDSKNNKAKDLTPYTGFNMAEELARLWKLCFGEGETPKVEEQTLQHQWIDWGAWTLLDYHNCGVYAMGYIKRRMGGASYSDVMKAMPEARVLRKEMQADLEKDRF